MKDFLRIAFFLTALVASIFARADATRFSWSATDFVSRGYRNAPWIKDPFYPSERKFNLTAIISPDRAHINGKWLRAGEEIDGYRVKKITAKVVYLARRSEVVELKIKE